ncbi:MAG: DegT/DnrJ/EryC1/StrS aminotransferase family protein [Candidatus Micrarchaeaceae archaeon]|jgi:dTDP-4-amino-4,6-dideoxygalactose transaminase
MPNSKQNYLPFARPYIEKEEIDGVVDSLKSGWITMGPKTHQFEELIAKYVGSKHVVCVNSATAAMHLCLIALGIGKGDEVIIPSYTFAATGEVVINVGAKPVLVDVQKDTFCIDPKKIEQAITKRTKAIIPVHFGGQSCDIDEITKIAKKHKLIVIEDAAHAIGTSYKRKKIGTFSKATCFSFYATKNITTGEGGAVATSDKKLANKLKVLRLHGISKDAWKRYTKSGSWYYEIEESGWKYNPTDLEAALGIAQMGKIDKLMNLRKKYAKMYDKEFSKIKGLRIPTRKSDRDNAYHLYPLILENYDRSKFIDEMSERGIGCSVHFIPLHMHPFYKRTFGFKPNDLPVTKWLYEHEVSLPLFPKMSESDVNRVIKAVKEILNE